MLIQIAIGMGLIVATVLVASLAWWRLEVVLRKLRPWLLRPPHGAKLMVTLTLALLWIMAMTSAGIWMWAFTFKWLGIFPTLEEATYFALVAYTTLGFGDILLPVEWRLLSGMAAANGLLAFGLLTAMLVETLRNVRLKQRNALEDN